MSRRIKLQPMKEKTLNKYGRMCRAFLQEQNPAPEKEKNTMAWTRHMNMLKVQAEEVAMEKIVYR